MLVCLHIGAHKTATTYIQARLADKRLNLAAHGVGSIDHAELREVVANRLDRTDIFGTLGYAFSKLQISASLGRMLETDPTLQTIILSDENIAGPMTSATGASGLYPEVRRRVGAVLESLPGHDVRVFFAVRSYAPFLNSIYAFRAGLRKTQDLALFREKAFARERGWPEVVADICAAAGPERVTVWSYEAFVESPETIAAILLGKDGLDVFSRDDRMSLPSLSRKGLAVLDRVSDMLSAEEYAGLARSVARFKFDPPDEKFSMFSREETQALKADYASDLKKIRELGCAFVGVEDVPPRPDAPAKKSRKAAPQAVEG